MENERPTANHDTSGVSRRTLLGATGLAVAATGLSLGPSGPALGASAKRRVAVLGGGMAGLAAAHELAERGFSVTVYERKELGGKARSIPVDGTAGPGHRDLPGEHGFRFFPGFYHHVPDSMSRIPFAGNANGVKDNLVNTILSDSWFYRANGRADGTLFGAIPHPAGAFTPGGLQRILVQEILKHKMVRPLEAAFFVTKLVAFFTSSDERRLGQWEKVPWWDFVQADRFSTEYQTVLARGLTKSLVAAKAETASTRTIGNMAEAFIYNIMGRGNDGALDRVLNGPTTEVWIDPWVTYLRSIGVQFRVGQSVEALETSGGSISSARVRDTAGNVTNVEADWFVCAMPAEKARELWSNDVLSLDPSLEGMNELVVDWMNGIQFFLRDSADIGSGHATFIDSPWALTGLTQAQFWREDFAKTYGDGTAVDCLSVDVSNWDTPGILYGKPANRCTAEEVKNEVWAQIKAHVEDNGENVLPDGILHSWFLDPAIKWNPATGTNSNDEPLLINTVGSWDLRPEARTAIPNLFLAGDYVKTDIDLATMEGANESGRAATNAILDAADSNAERATMYKLYDPPEFKALKKIDAQRYKRGLRNLFQGGA
ncbi:hydroxysqualene dehydroxylase [Aeromicrobium terrae]|uniref:FAD-dependent oxidoreductase n=1 Tax=Aeromicrobium terrae TaxID=2498846 RepID=A0A5C8NJ72_9ACTN|nr:FAD-dependent oxidoreductase [Aeromicrobium terrae]